MPVSPLFFLQAPYPVLQTMTVLPSPKFSDSMALTDAVAVKRAMDGTRYTYVKTKGGRKKLKWEFLLTRNKGLELRAFIQSYFASQIFITDHLSRSWVGYFMSNPFEFDTPERGYPPRQGWPVGEVQAISIEFEGVRISSTGLTPTTPPPPTPPTPPGSSGPTPAPPPAPPPVPMFNITGPGNIEQFSGAIVPITWSAANVTAGATISLGYVPSARWIGWGGSPIHWIEVGQVTAINGSGTYNWDTTGAEQGIYYLVGYLYQNGSPTYSVLKTSTFEILP